MEFCWALRQHQQRREVIKKDLWLCGGLLGLLPCWNVQRWSLYRHLCYCCNGGSLRARLSSHPCSEICVLDDQQSLFWPRKGTDSSEVGTLLIQPQEYLVSTWPDWALFCSRCSHFLEDFPITVLVMCVLLSLVLSFTAAVKVGVWEILIWLSWNNLSYEQTPVAGRAGCQ